MLVHNVIRIIMLNKACVDLSRLVLLVSSNKLPKLKTASLHDSPLLNQHGSSVSMSSNSAIFL